MTVQQRPDAEIEEIRHRLRDDPVALVSEILGGQPNRRLSSRREKRWGKRGSFSLVVTGPTRGFWFDNEGGSGKDLLGLIRERVAGGDWAETLRWARRWLGMHEDGPIPAQTEEQKSRRRKQEEKDAREAARRGFS